MSYLCQKDLPKWLLYTEGSLFKKLPILQSPALKGFLAQNEPLNLNFPM